LERDPNTHCKHTAAGTAAVNAVAPERNHTPHEKVDCTCLIAMLILKPQLTAADDAGQ
jgi:hypothetical protein